MKSSHLRLAAGMLLILLASVVPLSPSAAQGQPLVTCSIDQVQAAFAALPAYRPTTTAGWVTAQNNTLTVNGNVFVPQGVNYYPSRSPWRRFLRNTDMNVVEQELTLLQGAGFNTLRLYLWNEALFMCPGSGAIPVGSAFTILDGVIQRAAAHNMRVLITLNDMPDLDVYPLYNNPPHIQAQTSFIVGRYRDEAAIIGWDMRNAGDLDYGSDNNMQGKFTRDAVLGWLGQTAQMIKSLDPRHLVTAGWAFDVESTVPYVDFVSFAHWNESSAALRDRFDALERMTTKPLLLSAFGFSTFERSEEDQARVLTDIISTVESENAAGWILWTAFDFPLDATCVPPACPSQDNREHHFGLWRTDYSPKPALNAIAAG